MSTVGNTMSTLDDVQYIGGYHEYTEGLPLMSVGGYHEYRRGC